jgi:hypothetical protein
MTKYVLLKSSRILEVWSDNVDDRNFDCYPDHLGRPFDIESDSFLSIDYDVVSMISENLHYLNFCKKKSLKI